MSTDALRIEKYIKNAGRLKSANKSSSERVGSGTIPNIAMSTAPPAMRIVPRTIHGENTSPRIIRAKNAFHRSETAPRGARMTTGRDAICTNDPMTFDEMKMAKPASHSLESNAQWRIFGDWGG
jgi:hypothetical protein